MHLKDVFGSVFLKNNYRQPRLLLMTSLIVTLYYVHLSAKKLLGVKKYPSAPGGDSGIFWVGMWGSGLQICIRFRKNLP